MLNLNTLTINNIRCFDSPQTVSFVSRDKLIQVDGVNENTGGSSGSGKTTLFLGLDYLLGINDIPATVLQSRLTKEGIEVTGEFDLDGKPLTISRSKKNGLYIDLDGDVTSGNVKLAEEKLDEILGVPRKILKKMLHKKQKETGFFLNMTAKETYEFLVEVLNLNIYIRKEQDINIQLKNLQKRIEAISNESAIVKESISVLERTLAQKKPPEISLDSIKTELSAVLVQVDACNKKIKEVQDKKSLELESVIKPVKSEENKEPNRDELTSLEVYQSNLSDRIGKVTQAINDTKSYLEGIDVLIKSSKQMGLDIVTIKERKEHIESATCPTCKQQWVGDTAQKEVQALSDRIQHLTQSILENKQTIDQKPKYQQDQTRLEGILTDLNNQLIENREKIADCKANMMAYKDKQENAYLKAQESYRNQVSEIELKYVNELNELNELSKKLAYDKYGLEVKYDLTEKAIKEYNNEIDSLKTSIEQKNRELKEKESEADTVQHKVLLLSETARLIKTYVLYTFQETLDLIGDMSTEILSSIPNMQTATVYFEGCKETKTGTLKDEVNAMINVDGDSVPIKSLSGGERTAIDLSVDLAVIDIIEAKSNKGANFFVMDEPFDGLDAVCKENCLEILKQVDTNKKIIMVDHSSELKEMVSDVITVVKSGKSSKILSDNMV